MTPSAREFVKEQELLQRTLTSATQAVAHGCAINIPRQRERVISRSPYTVIHMLRLESLSDIDIDTDMAQSRV